MADTSTSFSPLLSSNVLTSAQYKAQQEATAATSTSEAMGQSAFLKLFTTQLQNQDPTDPVKNEAFVAQLAQFSQLEALQSMKTSMDGLTSSMSSERLLGAASLMGKSIPVTDGPVVVTDSTVSQGTITLDKGADGIQVQVYNSSGQVVRTMVMGAQSKGDVTLEWDGKNDNGEYVANGNYRYVATVNSGGIASRPTVSTYATVIGVSSATDGSYQLEVTGGKTVSLADVKKIGY